MFSTHVALAALKGIRHATDEVNEVGNRGTKMAGKQIGLLETVYPTSDDSKLNSLIMLIVTTFLYFDYSASRKGSVRMGI